MIEESKEQYKEQKTVIEQEDGSKTDHEKEGDDEMRQQFKPWEEHEKGKRLQGIFKWKQHKKQEQERYSEEKTKIMVCEVKVKVKGQKQKCKETICKKIRKVLLSKYKYKSKSNKNDRVPEERKKSNKESGWLKSSRISLSEKPQERKKDRKNNDRKLNTGKIKIGQRKKNLSRDKPLVKERGETTIGKVCKQGNNYELVNNKELLKSGVEPNPGPGATKGDTGEENNTKLSSENNNEEKRKQFIEKLYKERQDREKEGTVSSAREETVEWSCDPESPCKTSNQLACPKCDRRITALFERIKREDAAMKLVNQKGERQKESGMEVTSGKAWEVEGKFTIRSMKWVLSCWSPVGGCVNVPGDLVDVSPEEVRWARMQAKENNTLRKHRMEMRSMKVSYRNMWDQIKYCNYKPDFFPDVGHWYNLELQELMVKIAKDQPTEGSNPLRSQLSKTQLAAKFTTYHEDCWADGASDDEEKRIESGQRFNLKTMNGRDRQGEMREKWIELWTGKKMKNHEYFRSGEAKLDDLADYETFLTSKDFEERLECVKRIMMQHSSPIKQGPFIIPMNMKKGDGAHTRCLHGGTCNTFQEWTTFYHPDDQPCREWDTDISYIEDKKDASVPFRYYASSRKPRSKLEGPAQERDTGFHFYPCNRGGCWVLCRCKLCSGQHNETHYNEEKTCNEEYEYGYEKEPESEEDDVNSGVKEDTTCYVCLG